MEKDEEQKLLGQEMEYLGPPVLKESERKIIETLHSTSFGGYAAKTELREECDLSPPVFSENIKNLEDKGYIKIEADSDDKRIKRVRPTGKAHREHIFFGIPSRWGEKIVTKWQIAQQIRSNALSEEQKEELKEKAKTYGDLYSEEVEDIENYEFEDLVEELGATLLHALARGAEEFQKETENLDESAQDDYEKMLFEADRVGLLKRNLLNGLVAPGGVLTSENIYGGKYDEVLEKLKEKYPFKWERGLP